MAGWITFKSLEEAAVKLPRVTRELALRVGTKLHTKAHRFAGDALRSATPDTDWPRGDMRNRWHESVGVTITARKARVKRKPIAGRAGTIKAGQVSSHGNFDAGAATIDLGRTRLTNGMMGGSTLAPRGITLPTSEKVLSALPALARLAIAEAEAEIAATKGNV